MNVLYEEEGEFKAGAVLSQSPASYQVESPHGRRSKIKAANVVLDVRAAFGRGTARRGAQIRRRPGHGFSLAMPQGRGVRLPGPGARLRRPRSGAVGERRRAAQAAFGADVFLPPRAGPLPGGAGGHAQARARRGGEEEAPAGADRGVGRRSSRASNARPRSRGCATSCSTRRTAPRPKPRRWSRPARRPGLTAARLFERCGLLGGQPRVPPRTLRARVLSARAPAFPAHEAPVLPDDLPLADLRRRSASTTSARRKSTTRSRSRACRTTNCASAFTSPRPALGVRARLAARRDRPRAALDRLHAGPQIHHAAGRCGRAPVAGRGQRTARGVAVPQRGREGFRAARPAYQTRARADRRQSAPYRRTMR